MPAPALSRRHVLLAAACAACFGAPATAAPPATGTPSETLVVSGAVKNRLALKVADLQAFATQVTVTATQSIDGKEQPSTLRGVPITAVLDRAALDAADRNAWKHAVVVATGTDGYAVTFSWSELFNTEVGPGVIVVHERDGKPLDDHEGRIALHSAKDLHNGPRNVHWLNKLDVRVLEP